MSALFKQLSQEARNADKVRKDAESTLKHINRIHKRLQDTDLKTREDADRLRQLYAQGSEQAEREVGALTSLARIVEELLARRGGAGKRLPTGGKTMTAAAAAAASASASASVPASGVATTEGEGEPNERTGVVGEPDAARHPFPPGSEVAARRPADKEWILARVVKWDAAKQKYELEDVEAEEGAHSSRFRVGMESVARGGDQTELQPGTPALAVFPGTTTFYNAVVVTPPSKRHRREYVLVFEDDDLKGLVPARRVDVRYVLPHPEV